MSHPTHTAEASAHRDELDGIHPGWRSPDRAKRRFDAVPIGKMRRIKWLLLRLKHIEEGRADWIIKIVDDGMPPRRCFAHSIPPRIQAAPAIVNEPAVWAMPTPTSSLPEAVPLPTVMELVALTGRPIEVVEAALSILPDGVDPAAWVGSVKDVALDGGQRAVVSP